MPTRIYAHDKMLLEFLIICAHIIIMSTYLHCYYYHHSICLLFWCCSRKEAMSLVCSNQSQKLKLKQKEQQNRKEEDTKDTSLPFFALFLIYKEKQDRGENWTCSFFSNGITSKRVNRRASELQMCACVWQCVVQSTQFTMTNLQGRNRLEMSIVSTQFQRDTMFCL